MRRDFQERSICGTTEKRGRLSLKGESWAAPLQYVGCVPFAGTHHQTERCRCVAKRDAPREALEHDGRPVVTTTDSSRQRASLPHEDVPVSVLMAYRFNFQGRQGSGGRKKGGTVYWRVRLRRLLSARRVIPSICAAIV